MPHLIISYKDQDDVTVVLGICEYTKRDAFNEKVVALCKAYGWNESLIHWQHCYDNQLILWHKY